MPSTLIATLAAALVLAATEVGPAAGAAPAHHTSTAAKVTLKTSPYGRVLFDGRGYALYLFTADRSTPSTCYGACAKAWPPFLTRGKPLAGPGVNARLLGTTRRRDGRLQVTYAGHPLYFYVGDRRGQIKCQNVSEFGGLWLVVTRNGRAVRS